MRRQAARQRLGRRGVPLLLVGVGQVCWGIGFIAVPVTDQRGLVALLAVMPLSAWAWVWVAAGLIACASAFLPEGRDRWGYVAAVMPPLTWSLGYFWTAVQTEYLRAVFVALWYLLTHTFLILWASSVAEYSIPRRKWRSRRAPPLYLFGVGMVTWAIGYVAAPSTNTRGLVPLLGIMPMKAWAAVWFFTGLITLTCMILPEGPDRWGFMGAAALPLLWAGSYAWEWITGDYERGAFVAVFYLTSQAGMAAWASGVPEYELPHWAEERRA
ncbi:hypothetical protein AB0M39_40175 [Streptomyces sp. NPDC051907]|uniref:hypothetical protein n=1 Tax=Streptomyces sp. NPDC051907 TaxID=3155284 RepID=UPI00342CFD6F